MKKLLNEFVFHSRLPWNYRLFWPSELDKPYLTIMVQWDQDAEWEEIVLEIGLRNPASEEQNQ